MEDDIQTKTNLAGESKALKGDITRILQEAPLPENHSFRTSGDIHVGSGPRKDQAIPIVTKPVFTASQDMAGLPIIGESAVDPENQKSVPSRGSSLVTPLRTLKDDIQSVVQRSKISLIRAASLEEDKKNKVSSVVTTIETQRSKTRTRHVLSVLFAIVLLVGIGGAALFGVYTITRLQSGSQSLAGDTSILFSEHVVSIPIDHQTSDQIRKVLAQAHAAPAGTIGSITRIVPVFSINNTNGVVAQRLATLREFLETLGARAPDDLLRALSDSFFFGIHAVNTNSSVMVIPVLSYNRAFAGMLAWEPHMNADLVPIFSAVSADTKDENGLPVLRTFKDAVMNNYDVRELRDDNGTIVLYYSFPTTQLLVIAESPYSFVEILSRLRSGRQL